VPETAVHKNHFAPCGERKVRLARKIGPMQTKTIAKSMHEATNFYLGLRVLAPDCPHVLAAIHTSSLLELFKEKFQDRKLFILSCPADLR
jgi:hypothetical protein